MIKLLINDRDNWIVNKEFTYLLWFEPSLWAIIISKNWIKILLDDRYYEKTKKLNTKNLLEIIWWEKKIKFIRYEKDLVFNILENIKKHKKVKIENNITLKYEEKLNNWKLNLVISKPFFEEKRIIKNENEIKNIKKAIKIIDNVFEEVIKLNKKWEIIWKTEQQLRWFIITKILEFWWEKESFETIVAFWENSAIPHHKAWKTIIWNWPLLIDMWAKYNSYCSDFTRTIWIWKKTKDFKEFEKIYNIVLWAYKKAFESWKEWIKARKLDKVARKHISENWYWEYFTHSLWHWVWLNIHELPKISENSNEVIKKWMIFTIEPWIYLPWKFWIRLENIVFVWKKWFGVVSKVGFKIY